MQNIKDKKLKKIKSKINAPFIWFNIICGACLAVSLFFSLLFKYCLNIKIFDSNSIGVVCQIVTSIVSFVTSIIGISISLQNDNCFGISVKSFNTLRKEYRYSITVIIILAILLLLSNIILYLSGLNLACLAFLLVSICFCIYVSKTEIPLMVKNEEALMNVIKKQLLLNWNGTEEDSKELKECLKYLICEEKNLQQTFNLLKNDDVEYNKYLLLKLLDIQTDIAFNLNGLKNQREQQDSLLKNIKDILYFHFDITNILEENLLEYKYLITRVLFSVFKTQEGKSQATRLIANQVSTLKYTKYPQNKKDFIFSIALSMLSSSLANNKFDFIRAFKKEISHNHYHLGENDPMGIMFFLLSLQMYYLSNSARNVTDDLKQNIRNFLEEEDIFENSKTMSWKKLYKIFLEHFSLEFKECFDWFFKNEHNWDVPIFDIGAHWVQLDENYILKFYLANLFCSHKIHNFNFESMIMPNTDISYHIKKIGETFFEEGKQIKMPADILDRIKFFLPEVEEFKWFEIFESQNNKFWKFINGLHKQKLDEKNKKANSINNEELAEKFKKEVLNIVEKEWGYNSSLDLEKEPVKYISLLAEKSSEAINYDECIIDFFTNSTFKELKRITGTKTIDRKNLFDKEIKNAIDKGVVAISNNSAYWLTHFITDEEIRRKYKEVCDTTQRISSKIFTGNTLFLDLSFAFNFEIVEFNAEALTPEQLSKQIEEFKRADGQYIYEGAFLSREQIEKYISEQYVVLYLSAKYKTKSNINSIIEIKTDDTNEEEE